jgi:HPt (histidine-containing phosphotransfer) domain-containing protein
MTKIIRKCFSGSRLIAGRKRRLQKLLRALTARSPELTEKFRQNAARNPSLLLDRNGKRKKRVTS